MNVFDIIGPVMIGPSSSHTAGVVRIGNIINRIIGYTPKDIKIKFHGSFARTYQGHGSDRAIIAGLLGFKADAIEIRTSLEIATSQNINYSFETIKLADAHPNTVVVESTLVDGTTFVVRAESIGGGNFIIRKINDTDLEFDGKYNALIVKHLDTCGMITKITKRLADENINIAQMKVSRAKKGGDAITVIEIDGEFDKRIVDILNKEEYIKNTTLVRGSN